MKKYRLSYGLIKLLLLIALSFVLMTACHSLEIQPSDALAQHITHRAMPCRVMQHIMEETCIPSEPRRVIVLSHRGLLSHVLTLGVKPIGSNANTLEDLKGKYLREATYLGKKIEGIQQVGLPDNPNLEKIVLLKPDLILAWEYLESIYTFTF